MSAREPQSRIDAYLTECSYGPSAVKCTRCACPAEHVDGPDHVPLCSWCYWLRSDNIENGEQTQ